MNRNVRSETPTSVGMAPVSRCARYRLTPRAATAPYLFVEPGLPEVDDRTVRKMREALRRRKCRVVIAPHEEPDERHAVHELLLRSRVEILALRRVARGPGLLDRIARDRVLVAGDEVEVPIVGEVAVHVEVRIGAAAVETCGHVEVRLEPAVDVLRQLDGVDLHGDACLRELRLDELCVVLPVRGLGR